MLYKKAQEGFINLIMVVAGIIVFVLALPWINSFVEYGVSVSGPATGFFIKLFPWTILAFLLFAGYSAIARSGS